MASPAITEIGDSPLQKHSERLQHRLLKTGLIGAGAMTITWWALIACGVWHAIEWVGA